jgi:GTP-binding protein EngB required for normal cell division
MTQPGATVADESTRQDGAGQQSGEVDRLRARLRALGRFVELVGDRAPAERLAPARELAVRAGRRLELSGRHTVVALAGTTGSGKSSLFNAISGLDLSRVAVRRPTTSELHACIWQPSGAGELLDWLGVPPSRRTARESALDGDDEAALRGLVLLDLPDFDSIDAGHREIVDRLVGVADLVIWVVDPQKYADRTVHQHYLKSMAAHDTATAVVLNQVDKLTAADREVCAADLRRLLAADGLPEAPVHLTSARTREGVADLRELLTDAVADRQAAVRRLLADLAAITRDLAGLVGSGRHLAAAEEPPPAGDLAAELAAAAGAPGLLDGAERDYRQRGRRATGWLFIRWVHGRDPKRALEHERYDLDWLDPGETGEIPAVRDGDPPPAERPAARTPGGPVRRYLGPLVDTLPETWRRSARAAVRSHAGTLADRLAALPERAATRPRPGWWLTLTVLQWVLGAAAVGGLVWWLVAALAGPMGYSGVPEPHLGAVPLPLLLFVTGIVIGVLLSLAAAPLVRTSAREYRQRLDEQLDADVAGAVRTCVVEPLGAELHRYGQARAALTDAAG